MSAKDIEKIRIANSNRIYSGLVEHYIGDTPNYAEICILRKDKTADRTKTAELIAIAIKEGLKLKGLSEDQLKAEFELAKDEDELYQSFLVLEKKSIDILAGDLKYIPVYTGYLSQVRGMAEKSCAILLATLGDITRFEDPSSLWHYCGVGNAETDKKRKGVECSYNPKMKSLLLGVIGDNLIKSRSQYNMIYYDRTERTKRTHPEWWHLNADGTKASGKNMHPKHGYRDGIRVMMKRFLCELWKAAYIAKGIVPPRNPYILNNPNHHLDPDIVSFDMSLVPEKQRKPIVTKTETKVDVYAENNSTFTVDENHSHKSSETQRTNTSQGEGETQTVDASHPTIENHGVNASQSQFEPQIISASHVLNEIQPDSAEDMDVNEC